LVVAANMRRSLWGAQARPPGRAEPAPPRRGQAQCRTPNGEGPDTTRAVIFSEGRGLRVREYGPDASRGMSPSPAHCREHGGQKTPHSGWRDADIPGVRSPPLPGVDGPRLRWPSGETPEMARTAVFSEGCALRVRKYGLHSSRNMWCSPAVCDGPIAKRRDPGLRAMPSSRACGARPSAGRPSAVPVA